MSGQSVNKVPVHDVKFMVWSALSATRLTEPTLKRVSQNNCEIQLLALSFLSVRQHVTA
jgi:hypothetical protein